MNKEIKIIDLLNKIANDEEVPKKIRYDGNDYCFCNHCGIYEVIEGSKLYGKDLYNLLDDLNDKVEIIEEDNKIKKIQTIGSKWYSEYIEGYFDEEEKYSAYDEYLMNKINELIDEVKKLKGGK